MITSAKKIINDLDEAIKNKLPFSLIRFGDGGLKLIDKYLNNGDMFPISRKEGIPLSFFDKLIEEWVATANEANYIDSPEVYINNKLFSKRKITKSTKMLMDDWRILYKKIGFTNENYCNPEIGYLLLDDSLNKNLIDVIKNKSVCCITNFYEVGKVLKPYVKSIDVKLIPGFFGNHYSVSFGSTMCDISNEANKYDIWLLAAGELGRVYSGYIKRCGGRALDLGKVIDVWANGKINGRIREIIEFSERDKLLFTFKK